MPFQKTGSPPADEGPKENPMNITTSREGQAITVRMEGRLTFEHHQSFKTTVYPFLEEEGVKEVIIDLGGVTYMDSSSLGMLLLLRERAETKSIKVALRRPSPSVTTILKVVQFDRLFEIRH